MSTTIVVSRAGTYHNRGLKFFAADVDKTKMKLVFLPRTTWGKWLLLFPFFLMTPYYYIGSQGHIPGTLVGVVSFAIGYLIPVWGLRAILVALRLIKA